MLTPVAVYHAIVDLNESIVDLEDDGQGQTQSKQYRHALFLLKRLA